jgi:hypothetical protein
MGFETVSGRNAMQVYQYPIYFGYIFILLRITSMPLVISALASHTLIDLSTEHEAKT